MPESVRISTQIESVLFFTPLTHPHLARARPCPSLTVPGFAVSAGQHTWTYSGHGDRSRGFPVLPAPSGPHAAPPPGICAAGGRAARSAAGGKGSPDTPKSVIPAACLLVRAELRDQSVQDVGEDFRPADVSAGVRAGHPLPGLGMRGAGRLAGAGGGVAAAAALDAASESAAKARSQILLPTIPADRSHLGDGSDGDRGAAIHRCRTPRDGSQWNGGPNDRDSASSGHTPRR